LLCTDLGRLVRCVVVVFRPAIDIVYHIYVCDIDKPWAIHRIASVGEQVVGLQWHSSGLQLLVATLLGTMYVYQMKVSYSLTQYSSGLQLLSSDTYQLLRMYYNCVLLTPVTILIVTGVLLLAYCKRVLLTYLHTYLLTYLVVLLAIL